MAKGKKGKVKAAPVKRSKSGVEPAASSRLKHDKTAAPAGIEAPVTQASITDTKVMGFTNLGNTCFFNSVLQVLVASPPLQQFFAQPNVKLHQGPLGGALQEVFDQVQLDQEQPAVDKKGASDKPSKAKKQKQKGSYAPQRLLSAVCKVAPHFKGFQQQDSHELLRVLLDGLQSEEAKAIAAKLKHMSPEEEEEEQVSNGSANPAAAPQGFLSEVFGGQLSSQVACEACDYTSVTLEPFMDLSLPIPSSSAADSETGRERRGQKGLKGKKGLKGELDGVNHGDERRLSAKQKKKLLKEERKAVKLERKRQPKASSAAGSNNTPASPGSRADSAAVSTSAPLDKPATQPVSDAAPPAATAAVTEAVTEAVLEAVQEAVADNSASPEPHDVKSLARNEQEEQSGTAEGKQQQCIILTGQKLPQQQDTNSKSTAHAEPAEQRDMLKVFESLSGKLPDMPKHEPQDDLEGLFQKAFHTCRSEMSPRGSPRPSPFSSHQQNGREEDLSLYEEADALSQNDGVILDASDEEEERNDGSAEPMMKSLIGNAEAASHLTNGINGQAAEDSDDCTNIGSLFDEDTAAADGPAAATVEFGADRSDDISDEKAEASEGATLQGCLQGFFQQETITWECPAEKRARRDLRRTSLGTDKQPLATSSGADGGEATPDKQARRTVSFSEAEPVVTLIPGSCEQRGQVFRTSHGDPPFCRPLRMRGAFLLLTTAPDARRASRMHIKIQPQDNEEATLKLASNVRHLATADVPAPKVGDDEEEVRLAQAQVLMDCTADLMSQKGLDGTRAWCEGGLKLRVKKNAQGTDNWIVFGQLPQDEGQGRWEYPSPTDASLPPTDGQVDFQPLGCPRRSSSSSSDSSASSPSSWAADALENPELRSLMSSMRGRLPLDDNFSSQSSSSNADNMHEANYDTGSIVDGGSATAEGSMDSSASTAAGKAGAAAEAEGPDSSDSSTAAVGDPTSSASTAAAGHAQRTAAVDQPESNFASEADSIHATICDSSTTFHDKSATADADSAASQTAAAAVDVISEAVEAAIEEVAAEAAAPAVNHTSEHSTDSAPDQRQSDSSHTASENGFDQLHAEAMNGHGTNGLASDIQGTDSLNGLKAEETPLNGSTASTHGEKSAVQCKQKRSAKKGGLVNVQRSAVKGYSIHKCPPLLTVHVKRFQQDLRGRLSKIDGAVSFPLNLDLTPFCDPKGQQTSTARYTLLGLVEHIGTMRSGHYVAYVQRGLTVSESPHLQSLLHKHGILNPSAAVSSTTVATSSAASAESALAGKSTRKGKAQRASFPGAESVKGKDVKANGPAAQRPDATHVSKGASAQESGGDSTQKQSESSKSGSAASSAATDGSHADHAGATQDTSKPASSDADASTQAHNGVEASQHTVPDDWENSDSSATEDSQTLNAAVKTAQQTNGVHTNLPSSTDTAGQNATANTHSASSNESPEALESSQNQTESEHAALPDSSNAEEKIMNVAGSNGVEKQRMWYYISDTQVKPVTEADVLSREAYILLYMRTA